MRIAITNPFRAALRRQPASPKYLAALLLLLSFCTLTPAQSPGDHELNRERQQRLLEEQRRRLEELRRLPGDAAPLAPASPAEPGGCVNVRHIQIEGAERLSETKQREIAAPFEGQCLNHERLNALLAAITQAYLDRGQITARAYLPAQDLSGGVLKIKVLEGRLEGIFPSEEGCPQGGVVQPDGTSPDGAVPPDKVLPSCGIPSPREIWMSFPGKIGETLNVRELEQMLDQLGRLPSRASTLDLLPGTEPGTSKIEVKTPPQKSWRAGARFDNSGFKSTGERQLGASLIWDSPLGLADQLSLSAGRDAYGLHAKHSESQGAYYSVPFGWQTFSYGYSRSGYRSTNAIYGLDFKTHGQSQQHRLRAERLLLRDSVSKTGAALGLAHLRGENYFEDIRLDTSSYRLSELELSFSHGRRIRNTYANLEAGFQRGIGGLGAQGRGRPQGSEPNARYKKYTLTLSALHPFAIGQENFSFESVAFGQKSEDALYSPQQIGLGGLTSVRGFKDRTLYGNTGGYWRNQLRWSKPVPLAPQLTGLSVALAYDMGAIQGNERLGDDSAQLSGAGIELAAQGKYVTASLTWAHTLTRPKGWERERPVYFSINLTY